MRLRGIHVVSSAAKMRYIALPFRARCVGCGGWLDAGEHGVELSTMTTRRLDVSTWHRGCAARVQLESRGRKSFSAGTEIGSPMLSLLGGLHALGCLG